MSLIDLTKYKTLSDRTLLAAHNGLVDGVINNIDYAIGLLDDPLPPIGSVGQVLSVGAGPALAYANPSLLVNAQQVMDNYLSSDQALRLESNLTLRLLDLASNGQTLRVAATNVGGTVQDFVSFDQTNALGDLSEAHVVNAFSLTADSATVTMTGSAFFQVNRLSVGAGGTAYQLPASKAATTGQVLTSDSLGNAIWSTPLTPIVKSGFRYLLEEIWPFALPASNTSALALVFGGYGSANSPLFNTGFGFVTPGLVGASARHVFLQLDGAEVWRSVKPANVAGNSVAPYLQMSAGFVLPPVTSLDLNFNPEGSLWYDASGDGLVLISSSGQRFIGTQSLVTAVNTSEVNKDFQLQPSSTLSVSAGSVSKPSLNIGSAGLISGASDVRIVLGGAATAKISSTSIEPAAGGATASAKILIDPSIGENDPDNPAYTFPSAAGLGLFRSATHAMGVAVKGATVAEFSDAGMSLEGNGIFNLVDPVSSQDAATKSYVDALVPDATVAGAIAVAQAGVNKYVEEPDLRYAGGALAVGSAANPGILNLATSGGGLAQVRPPASAVNALFPLPSNNLDGGVLRLSGGESSWVPASSITDGFLRADGGSGISGTFAWSEDSTPLAPMLARGAMGIYILSASNEMGFSTLSGSVLRVNSFSQVLQGSALVFNAPTVYLNSSINTYGGTSTAGTPTYAFAGEPTTGLGQTRGSYCSLFVNGVTRFSATASGATAHGNKIVDLATPTAANDAANKAYVDSRINARAEISFRVVSLPTGWTSANPLTLSVFDAELIYLTNTGTLVYESASDPTDLVVPSNFATDPLCQVYVQGVLLAKQANASSVRQAAYLGARSITLNYAVAVGDIIVVQLRA